jgi:hypothetical protein
MIPTTRKQREALFKIYKRDNPNMVTPRKLGMVTFTDIGVTVYTRVPSVNYRKFREQVKPSFDGTGCIMLYWKGMWLGIEKDGHTHS